MNVTKLKKAMDVLEENLGDGLLASDIYSSKDGTPIIALNNNPEPVADALFCRIINSINSAFMEAKFPTLKNFVLFDLNDEKTALILPLEEYQWGMLIDSTKVQLGLILNLAVPKALAAFQNAKDTEE